MGGSRKAARKRGYTNVSIVWRRILMEDCVTLFDPFRGIKLLDEYFDT